MPRDTELIKGLTEAKTNNRVCTIFYNTSDVVKVVLSKNPVRNMGQLRRTLGISVNASHTVGTLIADSEQTNLTVILEAGQDRPGFADVKWKNYFSASTDYNIQNVKLLYREQKQYDDAVVDVRRKFEQYKKQAGRSGQAKVEEIGRILSLSKGEYDDGDYTLACGYLENVQQLLDQVLATRNTRRVSPEELGARELQHAQRLGQCIQRYASSLYAANSMSGVANAFNQIRKQIKDMGRPEHHPKAVTFYQESIHLLRDAEAFNTALSGNLSRLDQLTGTRPITPDYRREANEIIIESIKRMTAIQEGVSNVSTILNS